MSFFINLVYLLYFRWMTNKKCFNKIVGFEQKRLGVSTTYKEKFQIFIRWVSIQAIQLEDQGYYDESSLVMCHVLSQMNEEKFTEE